MKTYLKSLALAAASFVILTATSHAAIVFTDTFDSGTGAWYRAGTVNTLTNTSQQLSWTTSAGGTTDAIRLTIGRAFPTTSLAVGQTLRLSFDVTQSGTTSLNILRVGLYDVATPITADDWSVGSNVGAFAGYVSFIRDNSLLANPARYDAGTDTNNTTTGPTMAGTGIGSVVTQYDILQSTTYQGVFDITRTSPTQMDTLFTLSSGITTHFSVSGTTSSIVNSFDTALLRVDPTLTNATALFDNIQLEVIPEPSAALLGSLGLLALLRRRR